jgi:5'-deoxynucleotidase YfbR-like HD superfamily hydrolase
MHPENVAEHSFYVAFYCLMIAKWHNSRTTDPIDERHFAVQINIPELLQRALIHDLEEAVSGDFPRRFKHSTPELKQTLDVASMEAFKQVLRGVWYQGESRETKSFFHSWANSKDDTIEGRILEFSDFIAVLGYLWEEIRGGVSKLGDHVQEMVKYYSKFEDPKFDFLRPLVIQAGEMMASLGILNYRPEEMKTGYINT